MNPRTVARWAAIAFVAWWVIQDPHGAQHYVHDIGTFSTIAANGISRFFASI